MRNAECGSPDGARPLVAADPGAPPGQPAEQPHLLAPLRAHPPAQRVPHPRRLRRPASGDTLFTLVSLCFITGLATWFYLVLPSFT